MIFSLKSKFSRQVLTLMTGTTIAQAIPLSLTPVLSRLFTPQDFGVLAFYMSVVSIISSFVTLKYELAIILPEKDDDSVNIVGLSIIFSVIISLISFIVILIFNKQISSLSNDNPEQVSFWLYFAPISILFIGLYNSLNYWSNRKSHYKRLAASRIIQSTAMASTQIGGGLIYKGPFGLIFGEIFGRIFSTFALLKLIWKDDKDKLKLIKKDKIKFQFKRYKNFPVYSLPADLVNVISNQIPIFAISRFFGGFALGNYSMMEKVFGIPITLIGRSILDVFKQRASYDYVTYGNCKSIFLKTFKMLAISAIIPTILIAVFAPVIFEFVLGNQWRTAGEYAQVLSVLFFFRFTVSPLSYMIYIAEKQFYDMLWQIGVFIVILSSFFIAVFYSNLKIGLICFTAGYSVMYIIYFFMSYKFAVGNSKSK